MPLDNGSGEISATRVRILTLPAPEAGELEDAQVEGMVADRELTYLYVGQEEVGIWKFAAEPDGGDRGTLLDAVKSNGSNLEADVEGLTIYYAGDGTGYLLASSQGDDSFAAYTREGNNQYLGNFVVGESGGIDGVQESDGASVINVPLGSQFPSGLLVVQDGSNDPAVVAEDGDLENVSTNFKFVPWENVANAFPNKLKIDTTSFNRRLIRGTAEVDNLTGTSGDDYINGFKGDDTLKGLSSDDLLRGGTGNETLFSGKGRDLLLGGYGSDTLFGQKGSDLLTGGRGSDLFVLSTNQGTDTITDFNLSQQDRIELAGGLSFGQLAIAQGSGSNANNTIISALGEDLAILTGVQAIDILPH